MVTRLLSYWEGIRTNYWVVPGLMSAGSVILSTVTLNLDSRYFTGGQRTALLWRGGAEAAQQVLSTIASSMITVAGVVFSITPVVFTMASSQFGPRILRNFMRDPGTQVVLGTFVSTFLYCLLVLRSVHRMDADAFVPQISVTCGLGLSVASLAVLIYFIHHVCDSIQAENVVAHVGRELETAIKTTYLPRTERRAAEANVAPRESELPGASDVPCRTVCAVRSGYLQAIETETLLELATEHDLQLRLLHHPGNFVAECNPLLEVTPRERCTDELAQRLAKAFILGRHRTPTQDIDYSVHQLAEVGVRALSPGINDPYTAIACIDWLGAAMHLMAERDPPSERQRDARGRVRLILHTQTFAGMMDRAFNQIRQYGAKSPAVLIRLLETFTRIALNVQRPEDRAALRKHADCVLEDARAATLNAADREEVEERHRRFLEACGE